MAGFDDLVKVYIENLNLPQEKKRLLIESRPKTLAEVSMWLKNHKDTPAKISETPFNPFSAETKLKILKEIQIFSQNDSTISTKEFFRNDLVDTDDASWGLALEKASASEQISYSQAKTADANFKAASKPAKSKNMPDPATVEAQDTAIENIKQNVNNAIEAILEQDDEDGCISKSWSTLKEFFDMNLSKSSVCRAIYTEQKTAELLEKAQRGELTKEEYFGIKFDMAIELLCSNGQFSEQEKQYIKEYLLDCSPEQLEQFIRQIKVLPNDTNALNDFAKNIIEEGKKIADRESKAQHGEHPIQGKIGPDNSIRGLLKSGKAKELMSFEEVYKSERGVEFSKENLAEYEEKLSQYMMATMISQKQEILHKKIEEHLLQIKLCEEKGDVAGRKTAIALLEEELIEILKSLYGDDEAKISEALSKYTGQDIKYKDGKIDKSNLPKHLQDDISLNIANGLLNEVDSNTKKLLDGRTIEDYQNDMAEAYKKAYGEKNASDMARAYQQDQTSITGKARTATEILGAGVMVAGMFISTPLAITGALVSSFGGIGVEALEEKTKKEGISEETKQKLAKEILQNSALLVVGGVAGKMGSAAKAALIAQKCPTLAACIADIGVDATISLLGDLALTGEIDLAGEGLSQVLSLVAGHVRTKMVGKHGTPKTTTPPTTPKTPHVDTGKLQKQIQKKYGCSAEQAKDIAKIIASKPEISEKLISIIDSTKFDINTLKEFLNTATKENVNDLIELSKNRSLRIVRDYNTGEVIRNDFKRILDVIEANPQYKTELMEIAQNSWRGADDIEVLALKLRQYPEIAKDILAITKNNTNIKFGYDRYGQPISHIDQMVDIINKNPDLKNEIIEYAKIQRRANDDTTNPINTVQEFVDTIRQYPEHKDTLIELIGAANVSPNTIAQLLNSKKFQPAEKYIDAIKHFAKMGYDEQGIVTYLQLLKTHPELKDLILSEPPKYDLIDKNPSQTPIETIQKRFAIRDNLEKIAPEELENLRKTLGDDFYNKVQWEQIIPENASPQEIKQILSELNEKSKFFARITVNEEKYGKNIQWAHQIYIIEKCAEEMIKNGESYDTVMNYISKAYRAFDVSKTLGTNGELDDRRQFSGIPREYISDTPGSIESGFGALTPFGPKPSDGYSEYYSKFMKVIGKKRTYKGIQLTEIKQDPIYGTIMAHPLNSNVSAGMDYIRDLEKTLNPLFEKVKNGEKLTAEERKFADETIAEIYFVFANIMPYERGSNGIADIMLRSLYTALGLELPALKHGVSLDLEAFHMDPEEFKKNWRSFFEE